MNWAGTSLGKAKVAAWWHLLSACSSTRRAVGQGVRWIGWIGLVVAGWHGAAQGLWAAETLGPVKPLPSASSKEDSPSSFLGPCPANRSNAELSAAGAPPLAKPSEVPGQNAPPDPQQERIRRLIQQLGHPDYFVRQRAQQELAQMGFEAFEALSEAEHHGDVEIAARVRYLIRLLRVQWVQPPDPPEVRSLLADYESLAPQQRAERIEALANLPEAKGADALCRVARFERFPAISKLAAVALISRFGPGQPPPKAFFAQVQKHLGRSRRPALQWLETYLQFWHSPQEALAAWSRHVETELEVFRRSPEESSLVVAASLLRVQSHWQAQLDRKKEAAETLARLLDLEQKGDPETLQQLADWLWEEKAYGEIEKLAERFREIFSQEPILLYILAQAQHAQGRLQQAEQTAQKALELNPGPQAEQILRHLMAALALRRKGFFSWAEQEFRYVLRISPMGHRLYSLAAVQLAEMLHDQGRHLQAAEALEPLVRWANRPDAVPDALEDLTPLSLQARMHYFYACHWEEQKDRAKQKQALQQALQADPTDVDTLIACYRLPDQPSQWKAHIQSLIQKAVDVFREEIHQDPEEATYYNHLAWLISNTEGDLDEALRCAQKAIELSPEEGAYYDTLARVYFARNDLPNALKYQAKAVQLEPHSQQIRRQFEQFQKAAQSQKTPN